jgi:hypothetical protein
MKKLLILSAIAALCAGSAGAQENYAQWLKFKNITVNTKASGANVSADVTNFPVLVRLDSVNAADVFSGAQAGGADLRFAKANGTTRLRYQIETWDAVGKTAAIWVLADSVKGNDSTVSLRLYWGKTGAADSSNGAAVFDTASGFQGVWHLGEATGATANDVTLNKFHGTPGNTGTFTDNSMPFDTAGVIGRGKSLRMSGGTSGAYFVMDGTAPGSVTTAGAGNVTSFAEAGPYTLSLWVRVYNNTTSGMIITKGDGYYQLAKRSSGGSWEFIHSNGTRPGGTSAVIGSGNVGVWKHVAGVRNGTGNTGATLYIDGVAATYTSATETATLNQTYPLTVGRDPGSTATRYLTAAIDEVTVATRARSADWLKLTFETQKPAASAVILGATQSAAPSVVTSLAYGDSTKAADTIAVTLGVAFNRIPTYLGGPVDSIKVVSGTLPAGLTVNKTSGALSGTATAVTAASNVVIRAWGHVAAGDSASRVVRLSVVSAPPVINYASSVTYLVNSTIAALSPSVAGSVDSFTVAPALPAGLNLSKTNGSITGTPTAASAAANYVVTAAGATGTGKDTVSITVLASEDYTTWTQRDTLWLNTQTNGAGTTALVRNFPVLVRLDSSAFASVYTQSVGKGADLRFLKGTGNVRLPHQIESWDSAGKKAAIWVLVDSVKHNDRTQTIRMLWGKAGASDLSSGPSVFDTANGYQGVWHLSGTGDAADATANGLTGTHTGSPASVTGLLGPGRSFDGTTQYFIVPNHAKLNMTQNLTISAWVNATDWDGSRYIVVKATGQNASSQYGLRDNSTGGLILETGNTSAGIRMDDPTPAAWHLITGTYGGGFGKIYLDGVLVTSVAAAADLPTTTQTVGIGRRNTGAGADHWFAGLMDEVRIQNSLRDSNWIKMEYQNQKAGQSLVWLSQPPIVVGVGARTASASPLGFSVKPLGSGMLFQLAGTTLGGKVALMDVHGRTVWTGAFPAGGNHLVWNGTAANGQAVSGGVYLARVTLGAGNGKGRTLEMKVPFTR